MHFRDIPQFPTAHYECDVSLSFFEKHMVYWIKEMGLTMDPDYQRGHVWTREQQIAFVEYILQGGEVGRNIIVNCPKWDKFTIGDVCEVVDGKQRLTALQAFFANEIPVFGHFRNEFTGRLPVMNSMKWRIMKLDRVGVLRLYLSFNGGGTDHSPAELARVQRILDLELAAQGHVP